MRKSRTNVRLHSKKAFAHSVAGLSVAEAIALVVHPITIGLVQHAQFSRQRPDDIKNGSSSWEGCPRATRPTDLQQSALTPL